MISLKDRLIDTVANYMTDIMTSDKTCGEEYISDMNIIASFSKNLIDIYKAKPKLAEIDKKYSKEEIENE